VHESGTFYDLSQVQGEPWRDGGDRSSSRGTDWRQTLAGWLGESIGRPAIFADGAPTPQVTSFTASRVFSRSVNATKADDMTLAGGASFNGAIFLVAAVVDRALMGSMAGERTNKSFRREVREKEMS
jgi:hypothetical protein